MLKIRLLLFAAALLLLSPALSLRAQDSDAARVEALLESMSTEQRVGQLFMVTLHGSVMTQVGADFLRTFQPGGISLFGANITSPAAVTDLTNNFQRTITGAGSVPLLIAIDQEGGLVARLSEQAGFTVFPAPMVIAAAGADMAARIGDAVAEELSAVGINMNLAPVADLETNRDNPIIFRRSFGNDPVVAGEALAGFIRGTQARGVVATAKHFPGHGETREDSHAVLQPLNLSLERLNSVELPPFASAIEAGVGAIMVAHIWYPALDSERLPASLSYNVVTGLLRQQLGYDGMVMTDALDMNAVDLNFPFAQAAVMAVQAGVDMLALGPSSGLEAAANAYNAVLDAVRSGAITQQRLDEAVRRILMTKARFGLLDWQPLDPAGAVARVNAAAHQALIAELFEHGVTVAYDRNDLVPVPADRSVAVIFLATRYQIQAECGQYRPDIRWVGISDEPSQEEIGWARAAADASDIAVVWTQDAVRTRAQADLVNALPQEKTVAVALFSPFDWELYPGVAAYVATYSPARPAVPAACAILFGALPGLGRLSVNLQPGLRAGSRDLTPLAVRSPNVIGTGSLLGGN
jgi:beta-N-acetylhexosaminidase